MHKIGKKGLFAFAVSLMLALLVSAAVLSVSAPSARRAVFADEQAQGNVAEVNGTQYATVKEAFENAPENGVVTLIADATHTATTAKGEDGNTHLSNSITVTKSLTFDLNGHTFAVSLPGEVYSAIYVEGGITFTLKDSAGNGKLTSENGYGVSASEGATLVVESGTIDSLTSALSSNNTTGIGNFTVKGGTLSAAQGPAIYMPAQGKLTITGGTLNGGVIARMGEIKISGGTLIAPTEKLDPIEVYYNFSGNVWLGGALTVMAGTYKFDNGNGLDVNITGGKFVNEFDPATYSEGSTADASQFANAINVYMQGKSEQQITVNVSPEAEFEVASGKTVAFTEVKTYVESLGKEYKGSSTPVVNTPVYNGQPLAVAEGKTSYGYSADTTLQDLIASADGKTVTLFGDTAQSITIPEGITVTLDLNGYTLTNEEAKHTITNNGNLTVIGNGTVDNVSHAHGALVNHGTAKLLSGTYTKSANSWYVLKNYGTMEIGENAQSQITVIKDGIQSSLIANGWDCPNENPTDLSLRAKLTIYGGQFEGGMHTVKNDGFGELLIKDGTFVGKAQITVISYNKLTIEGGNFTGKQVVATHNGVDGSSPDLASVITGGHFDGTIYNGTGKYCYEISGGTFTKVPGPSLMAEGFCIGVGENGEFIADKNDDYVANKSNISYKTLQSAIDADGTAVVHLQKDLSEEITVPAGKSVIINLNGHTLSASENSKKVVTVEGTLTLKNGSIVSGYASGQVVYIKGGNLKIEGDVTINRTVVGSYDLIYVSNGTLTVSGENNVFGDQDHTFYDGTASSRYLICQENSQIVLGGGATYYGGRYVVYTKGNKNASSSLTITGGTFLAYEGKDLFSVPTSGEYTFSVTGGTFNRMIDANDMPVNTVCCRENELFSVAALTAEIENIVSGISEAEFAWTAIADGYAYIAENGVYTVVGAETYSAWAKEQVENHVARLLAKNNYSEGAAAKINAYAQNAYAVIENTTAGTAENNEKIERAVYTAIREADSVPTVNAEFAETLAEAKAEVKLYAATKGVVYTDEMEECFADATAQTLDNAKAQAIAMVDAAAKAAADQAAEEAAKAEAEKALADAKKNAISELNLYASLKGVELKDEWTTAINEATQIQAVEIALASAETAIDDAAKAAADQAAEEAAQAEAEKALAEAKKNAVNELKLYASLKGVELKDEWTTAINDATEIQAVETALANAETAIDDAAQAAADQAAEEAAQAEAEKALAEAIANAKAEVKFYAATRSIEYTAEMDACFNEVTTSDEVAAAKEEAFKLARAAAALIPDNSVDETDIANAKADLEKWLNSYLDELVGGKVSVQNAEAFAQIGIILAQAEEETDLKTRLLKTYSEENAEKIVGYYEEALAALDAAETNADVQLAVLNFKVSVLGVEKVSDNAGMSGGEISVIVLLVLIVLMIVAVLAIVLKGRKNGSAEKTEKRRN